MKGKKSKINYIKFFLKYKYDLYRISERKKYLYEKMEKTTQKEYKKKFNKEINFEFPETFNEKLNVAKIYHAEKLKTMLSDKILVREWVKAKIGERYLIPVLGIYNSFDEIDFNKLPDKFVIKCNHDSASVTICEDKSNLDLDFLKIKYNKYFLKRSFAYCGFEMHYKDIEPKIIIEKNMGSMINDYKFQCFDGKPYFCRIDVDRFGEHKRNIYDMGWNLQPFNKGNYKNAKNIEKPENFNEMVEIVKVLSDGLEQVRVDLYDINGNIYFGEMTFTNGNGMEYFVPEKYDYEIGKLWVNFDYSRRDKILKKEKEDEK